MMHLRNKENNNGSKRQRWETGEKKGAYQRRKAGQEESEKGPKVRGEFSARHRNYDNQGKLTISTKFFHYLRLCNHEA